VSRNLAVAVVAFQATLVFAAPQPETVPTLHAQTRVVQIEVAVKDSKGHPVGNLSKKDFIVTDQGTARAIDIFSIDNGNDPARANRAPSALTGGAQQPLPSTVFSNRNGAPPQPSAHSTVILLDYVNCSFVCTTLARQGVLDLMGKVKPDERIALYVIGKLEGILLLQDYTTDRQLLMKSMREFVPRYESAGSIGISLPGEVWPTTGPARPPRTFETPPVPEYDAAEDVRLSLQSLAEHLALVPGRKSVYWLTPGFSARMMHGPGWEPTDQDWDPTPVWTKTIATLNEADVSVNAVDVSRDARDPAHCLSARDCPAQIMKQIANRTGGEAWFGDSSDIAAELAQGIEESRVSYTLGFYLAEDERDDKLHDLKVQVDRPGVQLSYRQGYYAGDAELPDLKPGKDELLETVLLNQMDSHDVGITADVDVTPGEPRGSLNIKMNLDTRTLSVNAKDTGFTGKVDEMFVELNEAGRTLAKISDTKDFEFTAADREHYDRTGVTWPLSIPLAPGTVKLAIIVRDTNTGKIGSLTVPIM